MVHNFVSEKQMSKWYDIVHEVTFDAVLSVSVEV